MNTAQDIVTALAALLFAIFGFNAPGITTPEIPPDTGYARLVPSAAPMRAPSDAGEKPEAASLRQIAAPSGAAEQLPRGAAENGAASAAVRAVRITCNAGDAPAPAVAGNGVLLNGEGLILTTAHIGQYAAGNGTRCVGESATGAASPLSVVFLPPTWATGLNRPLTRGTGESDAAILFAPAFRDALPVPPVRTADELAYTDGMAATYATYEPASGAVAAEQVLVRQFFTFGADTVDLFSFDTFGGAPASGASGSGVYDAQGALIGMVVSKNDGGSGLRATSAPYINRLLRALTGLTLEDYAAEAYTAAAR